MGKEKGKLIVLQFRTGSGAAPTKKRPAYSQEPTRSVVHSDARADFEKLGIRSKDKAEALELIEKLKGIMSASSSFTGELLFRYFSGDLDQEQLGLEMTRLHFVRHTSSVVIRVLKASFAKKDGSADAFHSTVIVGNELIRLLVNEKFLPQDDHFHSPEPEFLRKWIAREHAFFSERLSVFANRFGFAFNGMDTLETDAFKIMRAYLDGTDSSAKGSQ